VRPADSIAEMSKSDITLYHVPPSFYSQVARLVLTEANVQYSSLYAVAGPPLYETYEPWYLKLNAGGTVPTLVIGNVAIDESRDILHEVDARFASGKLTPDNELHRESMNRWLDKAYALPERVFAYGSDRARALGARVNRGRRKDLLKKKNMYPELSAVYDAKIADIESFIAEAADNKVMESLHQQRAQVLDELDAQLSQTPFVVSDQYTLADVMWTVTVSRQFMLGGNPLDGRSHVADWYRRMKGRKSFTQADVWERPRPHKMLPMVYNKFPVVIYGLVAVLALLVAGTYFLFAAL